MLIFWDDSDTNEIWKLGLYQIYFFPIWPQPDFAGFGMTNPAGARTGSGFSNWV